MSHSDSDDLQFESADEDQKNELSDLDMDEILNDDDDMAASKNNTLKQKTESAEAKAKEVEVEPPSISDEKKQEPVDDLEKLTLNVPTALAQPTSELESDLKKEDDISASGKESSSKPETKTVESGWDDSNFSDIEDNNDTNQDDREKKAAATPIEKEDKIEKTVKNDAENKSNWNAGWDDSKFSDIEDEDDSASINRIQDRNEDRDLKHAEKKLVEEKPSKMTESVADRKDKPIPVQKQPLQLQSQPRPQQQSSSSFGGGGGGGGWSWASKLGSNLLSSAASLTTQMLETVEASLGAPDPTELAAKVAAATKTNETEKEKKSTPNVDEESESSSADDSWKFDADRGEWFSINKITNTGTSLVVGSLDVLESVGKKTFEIISDKDPNLKQTKELLKKVPVPIANKPNLSQLLREAQAQNKDEKPVSCSKKALSSTTSLTVERKTKQEKLTFSMFFDEFKGTAHLEALEMLSSQANVKLEVISPPTSRSSVKSDQERLERLFNADHLIDDEEDGGSGSDDDDDDNELNDEIRNDLKSLVGGKDNMFDVARFETLLGQYARDARIKLSVDKVNAAYRTASLATREVLSPVEMFNESIKCFALITSNIIELFHKAAEAIFLEFENSKGKVKRDDVFKNVEAIFKITRLSIKAVNILSDDYSKRCKINARQLNEGNPSHIITDIFLEASNSNTFIGDAYVLFLPIFKYLLLKESS